MKIRIGCSPCPNDTFIFYALFHGRIPLHDLEFEGCFCDVETLNEMALQAALPVTKLSFAAAPCLAKTYELLDSGSALGFGCGPLLVSRREVKPEEISACTVVTPGRYTTAHFLFNLFFPGVKSIQTAPFDSIEDLVLHEKADLGVIIHESRFTYEKKGLKKVCDLGALWEQKTHLPIPLGGIFARKDLPPALRERTGSLIRESLLFALKNRDETLAFVRSLAQEMDESVINRHIALYVNEYSLSLGHKGHEAVDRFFQLAGATQPFPVQP